MIEYVIVTHDDKETAAEFLNEQGAEGWLLASTNYPGSEGELFFIFYREKPAAAKPFPAYVAGTETRPMNP